MPAMTRRVEGGGTIRGLVGEIEVQCLSPHLHNLFNFSSLEFHLIATR